MEEVFDAAIIGMGPGGEVAADRLLSAGKKVVVFESELIGGECAYWACIPSKTILRGPEVNVEADGAAGASAGALDWEKARDYRDYMARHLDDGAQAEGYAKRGATVVRGKAAITGPGHVEANGNQYLAHHIIIATGTSPAVPEFPGMDEITAWGNREVYTLDTLPKSVAIVGGSAVALETAFFLSGFGVEVTVLNRGARLLGREEPEVSALAEAHLRERGVKVMANSSVARGRRGEDGTSILALREGGEVAVDAVVFATGRTPRIEGLDVARAGATLDGRGHVRVDEHCWAAEGLWAIGDVTGIMPFTHVAKYQGRIVADSILGRERSASYDGIPRVVFASPEIAAVGLTREQAEGRGIDAVSIRVNLPESIARPWTYEQDPHGDLGILVDRHRRVLVGAWAIAPLASEWIHLASMAIRGETPLKVLRDMVPQFPSYSEAYLVALDKLGATEGI
ncbi:NAD(P)/FAD-dependent oxidoreductase [Paeniglutamicibacter sp. ABSL32-1]|uniref:dihydrolipoyl dehydrogenase family protein n=1 Tax=Paeniglutamicibacter quisquiliarum TaxID=2849498 RepID=UPI001C2D75C8|nr:NAD(P)/FAD-dependent oxidoreductase [Paeniglutamicibacter quisquiliarum]MBV1778379.1 NAD(P)/FAD-dependent oxidoreductase [Paeniglutamicibacter quisquiliarum]